MAGRSLDAPAKLNLHLGVYAELDERRYHRVDSVMVSLDLCDHVTVTEVLEPELDAPEIVCLPAIDVPQERNTCYKAATKFAELCGKKCSVRITCEKHIPDQAGLGGSSSDAAATLKALADLWDIPLSDSRVLKAAQATGADVPFFLDGAPAFLTGAGDVFEERYERPSTPIPVVLVRSTGPGVSTPVAYASFDEDHEDPKDPTPLLDVLRSGTADAISLAPHLANNLDAIACRLLPSVDEVKTWLAQQEGVLAAQVTGSGSCVFGLCEDESYADAIAYVAQKNFGAWTKKAFIV